MEQVGGAVQNHVAGREREDAGLIDQFDAITNLERSLTANHSRSFDPDDHGLRLLADLPKNYTNAPREQIERALAPEF